MKHLKTLLIAVAVTAAIPATSHAAVNVGSNLTADGMDNLPGYCPGASTCTGTNLSLPAASIATDGLTSPIDGVVVKFAVKSGSAGNPVTLRVLRSAGGTTFTSAGKGASGMTTAGIAEFPAQSSIKAGDSIGLDIGNSALVWATTPSASGVVWGSVNGFAGGLGENATAAGDARSDRELLLRATIEPDADKDGLGDETQDADVQDITAPVVSKAKATPKNKRGGKRVKVSYTLSEQATVTLVVERRVEGRTTTRTITRGGSPGPNKMRKRFRRGKYRVTLTATDAAGNASQPVTLKFKVKKRRR